MSEVNKVFYNGTFKENPSISFQSRMLHFGEGIFETFLIKDGTIVFLKEHLARLSRALKRWGWESLFPFDEVESFLVEITQKEKMPYGRLKLVVIPESKEPDRVGAPIANLSWWTVLKSFNPEKISQDMYLEPIRLEHVSPMKSYKFLHYADSAYYLRQADKKGFNDIIYLLKNEAVLESSVANIFFMKNNTLFTPSTEDPILDGITRGKIIEVAKSIGIQVEELRISVDSIPSMEGAFLTSSVRGLVPVMKIGEVEYSSKSSLFDKIVKAYSELIRREVS